MSTDRQLKHHMLSLIDDIQKEVELIETSDIEDTKEIVELCEEYCDSLIHLLKDQ